MFNRPAITKSKTIERGTPDCAENCEIVAKAREQLSMILDIAPVGIWMHNGKGKLSFVNRAFCEAIGLTEAQFLAVEHYSMLLPEQFVPSCLASDAKARASKTPTVTIQQLPMADGQIHDLEVYKAVRRDASGEPIAMVGIAIEATAKLADARSMRQARETAESLNRAKSEFLQTMSHELLTPLNAIIGLSQLMEDDETSPDRRSMLQDILSSGENLAHIVRTILNYAQLEARTLKSAQVVFNPATEIHHLFSLMTSNRKTKKVEVFCTIGQEFNRVMTGDINTLKQVLTVLLRNALDFTQSGKITLSVEAAKVTPDGVEMLLTVTDTGVGISASFMPHLFTPFRQADASSTRTHNGIGLDLALSKRLIEHMGGELNIESVEGQGVAARVRLQFSY
ncbi:MAG: PAS domain-containing sensor histidine kinase [Rhodocyclaceae bacterium]|nr:PAS domain-containing sensor histidine kinase [Rhodocyclaceae bacterium]